MEPMLRSARNGHRRHGFKSKCVTVSIEPDKLKFAENLSETSTLSIGMPTGEPGGTLSSLIMSMKLLFFMYTVVWDDRGLLS